MLEHKQTMCAVEVTCEGPRAAELADDATLDGRAVDALGDVSHHLHGQILHAQLAHVRRVRDVSVVAAGCDDVHACVLGHFLQVAHLPVDATGRVLNDAAAAIFLNQKRAI